MERAVLAEGLDAKSGLAARLLECATVNGAESIKAPDTTDETGEPADFFTVDLNDPSLAGCE